MSKTISSEVNTIYYIDRFNFYYKTITIHLQIDTGAFECNIK